ncbi:MAG: T9SS type A sorting domain-containing protein [Bacteroidia bacterium]
MKNKVLLFLLILSGSYGMVAQTAPFPCELLTVDSVQTSRFNPKLIAVTITNHDTAQTWGPTYLCAIDMAGDTVGSVTMCGCVILFKRATGTFNLTARDTNFRVPPNYCCNLVLKGSGSICPKKFDNCTFAGIAALTKTEEGLNLFPNPASSDVTLDLGVAPASEVVVSVLNIQGRKVQSQVLVSQLAHLDVSMLAKGLYLVQISGKGILPNSRKLLIN